MKLQFNLGVILLGIFAASAALGASAPNCMDGSRVIGVDNAQALNWKFNSKNEFKARSYIEGVVTRVFKDKGNHNHFEIQIGQGGKDVIEVVYNNVFGPLPQVAKGMQVQACGDYITSYAKSSKGYDASPSGAIIHWVHQNVRRGDSHEHGFLVIDNVLYGFKYDAAADPRNNNGKYDPRDNGNNRGGNVEPTPSNDLPPYTGPAIPPPNSSDRGYRNDRGRNSRIDCRIPKNRDLRACRRNRGGNNLLTAEPEAVEFDIAN